VPAPVLIANPSNLNITMQPGETYYGEYKLTNYGLVAGDNLKITTSSGSGLVLETLVTDLPRIEAMQTISVPFRLTMLGSTTTTPGAGGGSVAEVSIAGGNVSATGGGGYDPCQPQPAATYNVTTYTCVAGIMTSSSATVNIAARTPPSIFGICDEGCNPCECLPGMAGNICRCLRTAAVDKQASCDCLIAGAAASACSCLTAGDPLACMSLIPGPIGAAAGAIDFGVRCALNIVKCTCQWAPSICAGGSSSAGGGGGGGGGGWGGYGSAPGGISSNIGCH
jgi:hypothetical protein